MPLLSRARMAAVCVCLGALFALVHSAAAQVPPASVTRWDVHAGTATAPGGATQNPAAIADANGLVWFAAQGPELRLGWLNPSPAAGEDNYQHWVVPMAGGSSGTPVGLAVAGDDVWFTTGGSPHLMKMRNGVFRSYTLPAGLGTATPRPFAVTSDGAYAYVPVHATTSGQSSIYRIPVGPTSSSVLTAADGVKRWVFPATSGVQHNPRHLVIDGLGRLWFTNANGPSLQRLDPSDGADPKSNLKTWTLPAGTVPAGLHLTDGAAGAATVCLVSEGTTGAATGGVLCLDIDGTTHAAAMKVVSRVSGAGFEYPQQISRSPAGELFLTEQNADAVNVVAATAATTSSTIAAFYTAIAQTHPGYPTLARGRLYLESPTTNLAIEVVDSSAVTAFSTTVASTKSPLDGFEVVVPGQYRYTHSATPLMEPVGITPVVGGTSAGSGTVYFTETFREPSGATQAGGRIGLFSFGEAANAFVVPATVAFQVDVTDTVNPGSRVVDITNSGPAVLSWTAAVSAGEGEDIDWLTVTGPGSCTPASGQAACGLTPGQLVLSVDRAGVTPGTYVATITIADAGGDTPDAAFTVEFEVTERPRLVVMVNEQESPLLLAFSALNTGTTPPPGGAFEIESVGGTEPLTWSATLNLSVPAHFVLNGEDVGTTIENQQGPAVIGLQIDCANGQPGIEGCIPGNPTPNPIPGTIVVTSPNASNGPVTVNIEYKVNVSEQPWLSVDQPGLTLAAPLGGSPATAALTLTNGAATPIIWAAVPSKIVAPAVRPPAWLTLTPACAMTDAGCETPGTNAAGPEGGKTPLTITVDPNHASVHVGENEATITLDDHTGGSEPVRVVVRMIVQAPRIDLAPATLNITRIHGQQAATQAFTVNNGGDALLNFTAETIEDSGSNWLSVSPAAGAVTPDSATVGGGAVLTVSAGRSGLTPGTYQGRIRIKDSTATNNPQVVTVTLTVIADTAPPELTVPSGVVAEATGALTVVTFETSAVDAVEGTAAVSCTVPSGSGFPVGPTMVTCTAADSKGNTATAAFVVTVRDTTPPAIAPPADLVLEAAGPDGAVAAFIGTTAATASDAVSMPVTIAYSPASGSLFPLGTSPVTITAIDAAGNVATASFGVTVRDTTPPTIVAPADLVLELTGPDGAVATFAGPTAATATDAVSAVTITYSPASESTFALGTTTVTATATDKAGNSAQATFTVTIKDTVAPEITAPAALVLEATSPDGATPTFAATAIDASGTVDITYTRHPGTPFPLGTTSVTATATDASGNTSSVTFEVVVRDTTSPVLALPADITEDASSASGAVVTFTATATDLVGGALPVTCAPASGSTFAAGSTTVNCSASDAAGNAVTGSFTVTVNAAAAADGRMTGAGYISVPGERVSFGLHVREREGAGERGYLLLKITYAGQQHGDENCRRHHHHRGRWNLRGADDFVSRTVTSVLFSDDPGFIPGRRPLPAVDTVVFSGVGEWNGQPGYRYEAVAKDRGEPGRRIDVFAVTIRNAANQIVAHYAEDTLDAGNIQSHRLRGSPRPPDTTPPVLRVPDDIVTEATGSAGARVNYSTWARDAASGHVDVMCAPASGSVFPLGVTTVSCLATDDAGNDATATFTVTVRNRDRGRDDDRDRDGRDRGRDRRR